MVKTVAFWVKSDPDAGIDNRPHDARVIRAVRAAKRLRLESDESRHHGSGIDGDPGSSMVPIMVNVGKVDH